LLALQPPQGAQFVTGIGWVLVFVNERDQPFGRMGIAHMIERAGGRFQDVDRHGVELTIKEPPAQGIFICLWPLGIM
jgi:hypothetical protein